MLRTLGSTRTLQVGMGKWRVQVWVHHPYPGVYPCHSLCKIGERSEVTGSVDLRATAIVCRGSIKNPSESLGNTYEDGLNSL